MIGMKAHTNDPRMTMEVLRDRSREKFKQDVLAAGECERIAVPSGLTPPVIAAVMDEVRAERAAASSPDLINHPPHYTGHPSGVECIQVTEHMGFNLGNAVKYIWRCGSKGDPVADLEKARWYIDREISRLQKNSA